MKNTDLVLKHYNKFSPINCSIISGEIDKLFTIKFNENENTTTKMQKGDPVLIGVLDQDYLLNVSGGYVVSATPREDEYILCSNEVVPIVKEREKRQYERYFSSLLCDLRLSSISKRESGCVKDISYSGMRIYSEGEFNPEDVVEVTIYLSNNIARFDGTIIRKEVTFGRNEYGVQIIHRDKGAMEAAESQILTILQNEKEIMLRHILNANFKI